MLTKAGVKLLDFGLAKLTQSGTEGHSALSELPTQQKALTAEGAIIGTFQYMAPEQLEGKDVDTRTDVFAFGVTLYEMLTGKRPFEGKSAASLIAAIIEREPRPLKEINEATPPALSQLIEGCLAKDPEDRWQSSWVATGSSTLSFVKAAAWPRFWLLVLDDLQDGPVADVSLHHFFECGPRLREGEDLGHRLHTVPLGERQGIRRVGGRARGPALDAAAVGDEGLRVDLERFARRDQDEQTPLDPQAIDEGRDYCGIGRCGHDDLCTTGGRQALAGGGLIGIDVVVGAQFTCERLFF